VGKGWLLDTNTTYQTAISTMEHYEMVYQKDKKQQCKYGIYDVVGKRFLLPMDYQGIKHFDKFKYRASEVIDPQKKEYQKDILFGCCKQKKWGLFDPKQQKWLIPLQYDTLVPFGDSLYWVLHEGKYQFINEQNQLVLSEKFDKMGSFDMPHSFRESYQNDYACFAPQKDSMIFFNIHSFPQKIAFSDLSYLFTEGNMLKTFENGNQKWALNRHNRIVMSPDYELLMKNDNYLLTRHKETKKQYFIDNQGNKQSFSSQYLIQWFNPAADFVLVADAQTKRLGAMTMGQKTILPCSFFAMTVADSQGVIWARPDFGMVKNSKEWARNTDKMYQTIDSNWQMYDKKGALLTPIAFDYPFLWATNQVGIGQVHRKQGIWNTKGQNILPAQYDKIEYDLAHHVFYLFETIGEKQHCIGFASVEGQLVIDKTILNMSFFDGDNAFVETAAGYGIIQKNGTYLITPAPNALQKAPFAIMPLMFHDSDALNKAIEARNPDKSLPTSRMLEDDILQKYHLIKPYSEKDTIIEPYLAKLKPPFSQMLVENLMLELMLPTYFLNNNHISESKNWNYVFYLNNEFHHTYNEYRHPRFPFMTRFISSISCRDKTIYLDWVKMENHLADDENRCDNYQLKNNIWRTLF
jgi:hypothetical protein